MKPMLIAAAAAALTLGLASQARADNCRIEGIESAFNRVMSYINEHGNAADKRAGRTAMQQAVRAANSLNNACQAMERRRNSPAERRRRQGGNGRAGTVRQD
jgi:hypothetical protein